MMTSCDGSLRTRVTYIKIALDEMFTISNTIVTTLQGFFEAFAKDSIA
jgi:hypothetical protein